MSNWTDMSRDRLIKEYRKHPCLWSNKDGDAKNAEKRKESLMTITLELNKYEEKQQFTEEEVRTQFKNLRDMYRRKRKRLQLQQEINPAAVVDEPGWIYFARLKFLDDGVDFGLPNGSPPPAPPPKKKCKSGASARTSDDASLPTPLEETASIPLMPPAIPPPPPPSLVAVPSPNTTAATTNSSVPSDQQQRVAVKKEECCSPDQALQLLEVPETAAASLLLLGQTVCTRQEEQQQLCMMVDSSSYGSSESTTATIAVPVPMVEEKQMWNEEAASASRNVDVNTSLQQCSQQSTQQHQVAETAALSPTMASLNNVQQQQQQMVEIVGQQQQQKCHQHHQYQHLSASSSSSSEGKRRAAAEAEGEIVGVITAPTSGGRDGEDEFTCFGRFVAMTMKKIAGRSPIGALEARKQINDVLYHAELDSLSRRQQGNMPS